MSPHLTRPPVAKPPRSYAYATPYAEPPSSQCRVPSLGSTIRSTSAWRGTSAFRVRKVSPRSANDYARRGFARRLSALAAPCTSLRESAGVLNWYIRIAVHIALGRALFLSSAKMTRLPSV
ncbi:hypothetical protein FB451DRAFT_1395892 [Mycena latifolia]|nr:hypothetical protein FB451DRAFT_1395892 [Mycena latifolia]